MQILLPADRPGEVVLATNFGLISTDDGGHTWRWSCEAPALTSAFLYQVGPPPLDRVFAVSDSGVVSSDDQACSWRVASGSAAGTPFSDVFPDQSNTNHVLAIRRSSIGAGQSSSDAVVESNDGGLTFDTILYRAAPTDVLMGVEGAATDPGVIYVPLYTSPGLHPKLLRTTDHGVHWDTVDLEPMVGNRYVRIIAIDRDDPRRLYLRIQGSPDEHLGISNDSGTTLALPVDVNGALGGFAVLPSGTIVVGGVAVRDNVASGISFRSRDRGVTFQALPTSPRVRAFAQRDGTLFAATDNFADGFALATSNDEGTTFAPVMKYADVSAVKDCVRAACETTCLSEVSISIWPRSVCGPDDGGRDARATGAPPRGCTCAAAGEVLQRRDLALLAAGFLAALRRPKKKRSP
jgi:hypothetical protein